MSDRALTALERRQFSQLAADERAALFTGLLRADRLLAVDNTALWSVTLLLSEPGAKKKSPVRLRVHNVRTQRDRRPRGLLWTPSGPQVWWRTGDKPRGKYDYALGPLSDGGVVWYHHNRVLGFQTAAELVEYMVERVVEFAPAPVKRARRQVARCAGNCAERTDGVVCAVCDQATA